VVTHQIENDLGGEAVKTTEKTRRLSPDVGGEGSLPPGAETDGQQFIDVWVTLEEGYECLLDYPTDGG
jgi:hypothetical protein